MKSITKRTKYRRLGYQPAGSHIIHTGGNARERARQAERSRTPLDPPNRPDMAHTRELREWLRRQNEVVVSTPRMIFSKVIR